MTLLSYPKISFDKKRRAREQWVPGDWEGEEHSKENRDLELELGPKNRRTYPTALPRDSCHYRLILMVTSYLVTRAKGHTWLPWGQYRSAPVKEIDSLGTQYIPLPLSVELVIGKQLGDLPSWPPLDLSFKTKAQLSTVPMPQLLWDLETLTIFKDMWLRMLHFISLEILIQPLDNPWPLRFPSP